MKPSQGRLEGSHAEAHPHQVQKEGGIELEHKREEEGGKEQKEAEGERGRKFKNR